eukprot:2632651-Pyramimonas_sp.AAC.1
MPTVRNMLEAFRGPIEVIKSTVEAMRLDDIPDRSSTCNGGQLDKLCGEANRFELRGDVIKYCVPRP